MSIAYCQKKDDKPERLWNWTHEEGTKSTKAKKYKCTSINSCIKDTIRCYHFHFKCETSSIVEDAIIFV